MRIRPEVSPATKFTRDFTVFITPRIYVSQHDVTYRCNTWRLCISFFFSFFFLPRIHTIQCTNDLLLNKSRWYSKYSKYFGRINSLYKYMYVHRLLAFCKNLIVLELLYQFRCVVQFTQLDERFSIVILYRNTVCMILTMILLRTFRFPTECRTHLAKITIWSYALSAYHKILYLTIAKFKGNFPTKAITLPRNKRI